MGHRLIEKMLPTLEKMEWPEAPAATELGRKSYEIGLDKVDEFKDDPKVLGAALRIFQSGDSRPYALAGVAYTLVRAAREDNGSYAKLGLSSALEWLESAQENAPDVVEINMVEAFIYIFSNRFDDARLILDYLEEFDDNNYHLMRAETAFWQAQNNLEESVKWYERAIAAADSVPRKLQLRTSLGDCLLSFNQFEKALEVYKEAIHFSKENPWLWHNMSLVYWNLEDYQEADRHNKHALALDPDLPNAQQMAAALEEKLNSGSFRKRLFGR